MSDNKMPVEIAVAVNAVMRQVRTLGKTEKNVHAGYGFASIDSFLEAIGPLCADAGLIIFQDEHEQELIERTGRTGAATWLRITYDFTLAHVSGACWQQQTHLRTVYQRIEGPQTTGSTQSYALKQFLRSLFMIPTGDKDDADYQAKEEMGAAPSRPPETLKGPGFVHIPMQEDNAGNPLAGRWTKNIIDAMDKMQPGYERRIFLDLHEYEMKLVAKINKAWAEKIISIADGQ